MQPSLASGQYILVSRTAYWLEEPVRGDIVVVHDPQRRDKEYFKRVVGLPGECVHIEKGQAFVNGEILDEPYVEKQRTGRFQGDGEWSLIPGHYFVLGDNRNDSRDSRAFGSVPRHLILGKAWVCYWPRQAWGKVRHSTALGWGSHRPR